MKKILKITISVFILTLLVSSFRACALHQVAVNDVTVPRLRGIVTAKRSTKENSGSQKFQTSVCKNNLTGNNELIEVQTYNGQNGKYSSFVSVPKNQTITIPNGNNITAGVQYALNARNTKSIVNTVNFWGIWLID